jgi:hypothetical protein
MSSTLDELPDSCAKSGGAHKHRAGSIKNPAREDNNFRQELKTISKNPNLQR